MMQFVTGQIALATLSDGGHYSIVETTASRVFASSADPYNDRAVSRILKAKNGSFERAPDDPDEFVSWLER